MGLMLNQTSIDRDGILFVLDAKNPKSYPGSGSTWYDITGNGYNFTLVNGPTYNSNGWFELSGSNQYFSYSGTIPNHTELTVITQLKYDANVTFEGIVMSRDSTGSPPATDDYRSGNWVVNQTNGAGRWGLETNGLSANSRIGTNIFGLPMSTCSLVASGGNITYFLNGIEDSDGDLTYSDSSPNWEDHNEMFVGNRSNGGSFQGDISYVLVAHKAWDSKKISAFCKNLDRRFTTV